MLLFFEAFHFIPIADAIFSSKVLEFLSFFSAQVLPSHSNNILKFFKREALIDLAGRIGVFFRIDQLAPFSRKKEGISTHRSLWNPFCFLLSTRYCRHSFQSFHGARIFAAFSSSRSCRRRIHTLVLLGARYFNAPITVGIE